MIGVWDRWLKNTVSNDPIPFGDLTTYRLGAKFLHDCSLIEDWGCGKGGLRLFVSAERYRGVDGSNTPFADVTADLTTYRSSVPGVFIRHVLEHNPSWRQILGNACASAQERLVIILFTPLSPRTHQIEWNEELGVPDISFALEDLIMPMSEAGFVVQSDTIGTATQYGVETVLLGERQ